MPDELSRMTNTNHQHDYTLILMISAILAYFVMLLHPQMDTAPFLYVSSLLGLSSLMYAIKYRSKKILIVSMATILCIVAHLLGAWLPWQEPSNCAMVCFSWMQIIVLLGGVLLGTIFGIISFAMTLCDVLNHNKKGNNASTTKTKR